MLASGFDLRGIAAPAPLSAGRGVDVERAASLSVPALSGVVAEAKIADSSADDARVLSALDARQRAIFSRAEQAAATVAVADDHDEMKGAAGGAHSVPAQPAERAAPRLPALRLPLPDAQHLNQRLSAPCDRAPQAWTPAVQTPLTQQFHTELAVTPSNVAHDDDEHLHHDVVASRLKRAVSAVEAAAPSGGGGDTSAALRHLQQAIEAAVSASSRVHVKQVIDAQLVLPHHEAITMAPTTTIASVHASRAQCQLMLRFESWLLKGERGGKDPMPKKRLRELERLLMRMCESDDGRNDSGAARGGDRQAAAAATSTTMEAAERKRAAPAPCHGRALMERAMREVVVEMYGARLPGTVRELCESMEYGDGEGGAAGASSPASSAVFSPHAPGDASCDSAGAAAAAAAAAAATATTAAAAGARTLLWAGVTPRGQAFLAGDSDAPTPNSATGTEAPSRPPLAMQFSPSGMGDDHDGDDDDDRRHHHRGRQHGDGSGGGGGNGGGRRSGAIAPRASHLVGDEARAAAREHEVHVAPPPPLPQRQPRIRKDASRRQSVVQQVTYCPRQRQQQQRQLQQRSAKLSGQSASARAKRKRDAATSEARQSKRAAARRRALDGNADDVVVVTGDDDNGDDDNDHVTGDGSARAASREQSHSRPLPLPHPALDTARLSRRRGTEHDARMAGAPGGSAARLRRALFGASVAGHVRATDARYAERAANVGGGGGGDEAAAAVEARMRAPRPDGESVPDTPARQGEAARRASTRSGARPVELVAETPLRRVGGARAEESAVSAEEREMNAVPRARADKRP